MTRAAARCNISRRPAVFPILDGCAQSGGGKCRPGCHERNEIEQMFEEREGAVGLSERRIVPRGPGTRGEAAAFLGDPGASHLKGGACDKEIPSKTRRPGRRLWGLGKGGCARHEASRASYARPCDDGGWGGGGGAHGRGAGAVVVCCRGRSDARGQGMHARPVPSPW